MAHRLRRLVDRLAAPFVSELKGQLMVAQDSIDNLHGDLGRVHEDLLATRYRLERVEAAAREIGRLTYDEEPQNRRRLRALRETPEYEAAFTEAEPLVSFVVPTYNSFQTLREVALPSILGQTYSNLEVIVVGDASPPETERAVEAVADPRVSFVNRTVRGPYPEDPERRWFVIGSPPLADGYARARGHWIATLGDDDAVRPDHTERLLAAAREDRLEHCYGLQQINFQEGEAMTVGTFPPRLGEWGLQAALLHSGLRFIEPELADAVFEEPNDWSMCRRMLRVGVRTGMIDRVVVDKHESRRRSAEEWKNGGVPRVD